MTWLAGPHQRVEWAGEKHLVLGWSTSPGTVEPRPLWGWP